MNASNSAHYWGVPRHLDPEDMRTMARPARPGKTKADKRSGSHGNRLANRQSDPGRMPPTRRK